MGHTHDVVILSWVSSCTQITYIFCQQTLTRFYLSSLWSLCLFLLLSSLPCRRSNIAPRVVVPCLSIPLSNFYNLRLRSRNERRFSRALKCPSSSSSSLAYITVFKTTDCGRGLNNLDVKNVWTGERAYIYTYVSECETCGSVEVNKGQRGRIQLYRKSFAKRIRKEISISDQ